jgi:hypothetical protein
VKRQKRIRKVIHPTERLLGLDPNDKAGRWLAGQDSEVAQDAPAQERPQAPGTPGSHRGPRRDEGANGGNRPARRSRYLVAPAPGSYLDPANCSHLWATIAAEGGHVRYLFCPLCKTRRPA